MILGLEFPPIDEVLVWPDFAPGGFNKIALINVIAVVVTLGLFFWAGSRRKLVPTGVQNLAEISVEFIDNQIVNPTMGPKGAHFAPFLMSIFFFVFIGNIFEIIPGFQMPANARMANPVFLALLVWVIFIAVGFRYQGLSYLKNALFPPGVPRALYILVTPIEFVSTFLVRPFSLAVRLFANMLAGHLLLVTFAVLTAALWSFTPLLAVAPFSFGMLVFLTLFEVLVSVLQAYIFAILAAVYIADSMSAHH